MNQLFSTVKSKIILVLVTSTVITLIVGGFGLNGVLAMSRSLHDTYASIVIPTGHLSATQSDTLNSRLTLWRMVAQKDKALIPKTRDFLAQTDADWKSYYPSGVTTSDERAIAGKIDGLITQYRAAVEKELALIEQGDFDGALAWQVANVLPLGDGVSALLKQDVQIKADQARDSDVEGATKSARLTWASIALLIGGALLSIGAALYLIRAITRPLSKTVSIASDIAHGRLDGQIAVDVTGEFGQLLEAMKSMSQQLAATIRGIRDGSESVTVASVQIAAGNQDLSARTEEQAASLEQTAASMTELSETVKQNADNARQANSLATNAREMTDVGNAAVGAMAATMQEISADSARIADITGMIEGIAFQTNILALNAAVEAARAGEHGRGFAVVAGEVRALAQRASGAAKEIKELIDASSGKVRHGARQAGDIGESMGKVILAIGRVSDIVGEISAASDEQSKGIEQVHQAITQIDEVTQQNAALVEEAAAAAASLQDQATKMKADMTFFRLGDESSSPQRFAPSQPAPSRTVVPETRVAAQPSKPTPPAKVAVPPASLVAAAFATDDDEWEVF
ncbi:methyl-accepting chemotaxis protein [Paraburkholderia dinghuensis]|uniref:HAMP domain-containing protein n=1 Tax=Paraburkholderia dinghuensis TaxID=2305225 RepID=A0A3N6Q1I3_9BURK|nr:methyl-accepting chemotaxis protein [Paraburkholderia dinghuensis]RQH06076.1 HAMP domain-containing protein [Paraburkholderia dinghuensis]